MTMTAFQEIARNAACRQNEPFWLLTYRSQALERFSVLGLPTRRMEGWQFTDLRPLANNVAPATCDHGVQDVLPDDTALTVPHHRLVFVDGRFSPSASSIGLLPSGVTIAPLSQADPEHLRQAFEPADMLGTQAFTAFNAAAFTDGFLLQVPEGTVLEAPVQIIYVSSEGAAPQLRNLAVLGDGAEAKLIEVFIGAGAGWTNAVTRLEMGARSRLQHIKVQDEAKNAIHISTLRATLAQDAAYDTFLATLGARLSRQDLQVTLAGERARTGIHGVYLLEGEQEATLAPLVDHQAANCATNEVFKGVLEDRAHGVFLGTVMVREGADGTDAHQLNRNLLLSSEARVDAKPELTIHADDVKCSHGATVGDLDDTSFFYLLSRGIEPAMAKAMLIGAFVREAVEGAELDLVLSEYLSAKIDRRLDRGV